MQRVNTIVTNFTSGELTPTLKGRADIERFFNGAEKIENFFVPPQGGLFRRLGTKRLAVTACPDSRLFPFVRGRNDATILEIGCGEIKFIEPEGYLINPTIECSVAAESGGVAPNIVTYEVQLGEDLGDVYLTFKSGDVPDRFMVRWNNTTVLDSGYAGSTQYNDLLHSLGLPSVSRPGDGQLHFEKTSAVPAVAYVDIYAPIPGSSWEWELSCPGSEPPPDPTPVDPDPPVPSLEAYTVNLAGSLTDVILLSSGLSIEMLGMGWVNLPLTVTNNGGTSEGLFWVHFNPSNATPEAPDGYTPIFLTGLMDGTSFFDGWLIYETP